MARETTRRVRGKALEALASPIRLELLDALEADGPATTSDLARRLGRGPRSLYRHLHALVVAGLVVEAGRRTTGRRPAALYRLVARRLELDPEDRSRRARDARRRTAAAVFRTARALHEAALEDPATVLGGRRRELTLAHRAVRLTPAGLARVQAGLRELLELAGAEHDEGRGTPFVLTVQLAPGRGRGRRSRKGRRA